MNISRRLLSGAITYTISNFAVAGIPFVLMPVLTRVLSPEAYGSVAMFVAVIPFMTICVGLNVNGAIMLRYFNQHEVDMRSYVSTCIWISLIATGVLILLVTLLKSFLEQVTALSYFWLILAAVVAALQTVVQVILVLWQAAKQPLKYGLLRFSQASLDGALSVVLVALLALSWQGRLLGLAVAWIMTAMAALYLLFREGWLQRVFNLVYAKDALRFGIPLIPHTLGGLFLAVADRFLVTKYLDVANTGIYLVASQMGLILGTAADAFNKAFAPWLMESLVQRNHDRDVKVVRYTYGYFVLILGSACIGMKFLPLILTVMVGPLYQQASGVAQYMLLGNAFTGMYYMVTNYIFFARRTELLSVVTITIGSLILTCMPTLLKTSGLIGAARAFMFGQLSLFLCTMILAMYCHKMPWLCALKIK